MSVMRPLVCFLSLLTCAKFLGQVAASGHDVPGAIKLNPDGTVLVYNSHVNDFINICWVKDMSENIPNTICKQLGLAKAQHWNKARFSNPNPNQKKIFVKSCRNDASYILRCTYYLKRSCNNENAVAVQCNDTEYVYEGQLRLFNQSLHVLPRNTSLSRGWLQVYLNGEWTFVCGDTTFDKNEAETACRQLGYTTFRNHTTRKIPDDYRAFNLWVGANKNKLDCDASEDCLTKCYSKPNSKELCRNGHGVLLECDFELENSYADFASAGTPSACSIQEDDSSSESEKNITVGVVLGCISLVFVCAFGILITLYCCTSGKKPPTDDESSNDKLDHSYAEDPSLNNKNADIEEEEEHETTFNDNNEYQPPEVTPLLTQDDSTSDN